MDHLRKSILLFAIATTVGCTPSCSTDHSKEHVTLVQRSAKVSASVERLASASDKGKGMAGSGSLPTKCVEFFKERCGVDYSSPENPPRVSEMREVFSTCCKHGGHSTATCTNVAKEAFDENVPEDDDACDELIKLGEVQDDFEKVHNGNSAQSLQAVEHQVMDSSLVKKGDDSRRRRSPPPTPPPTMPKLRTCLFLHGAMVKGAWPPQFKTWYGDVWGALRTYWGPYNVWYADLCDEFLYSWADTETHAWDSFELQVHYADKAAEVIDGGGIVFAHSMANAILAGACWRLDKCVQWYSLGGGYSGQAIGNGIYDILRAVGPVGSNLMNVKVYEGFSIEGGGMRHDLNASNRNALAKVVDSKMLLKGSVCGVRPGGAALNGDTQAPKFDVDFNRAVEIENNVDQHVMGVAMAATSLIVETVLKDKSEDTRNDGLVEIASCAYWQDHQGRHWYGTGSEWTTFGPIDDPPPTETHILAEINHIEECGVFAQTTVAMNWMRNMMCRELQLQGHECPAKSIPMEWPKSSGKIGEACLWPFQGCSEGDCCGVNHHGICQHKQKDWFGFPWCPADCQGAEGFAGTCENEEYTSMNHRPRKIGEPCHWDSDCEGWISGQPNGCCDKVCTAKKKDWASIYWCPSVCKSSIFGNQGSC